MVSTPLAGMSGVCARALGSGSAAGSAGGFPQPVEDVLGNIPRDLGRREFVGQAEDGLVVVTRQLGGIGEQSRHPCGE